MNKFSRFELNFLRGVIEEHPKMFLIWSSTWNVVQNENNFLEFLAEFLMCCWNLFFAFVLCNSISVEFRLHYKDDVEVIINTRNCLEANGCHFFSFFCAQILWSKLKTICYCFISCFYIVESPLLHDDTISIHKT